MRLGSTAAAPRGVSPPTGDELSTFDFSSAGASVKLISLSTVTAGSTYLQHKMPKYGSGEWEPLAF